MHERVYIESVMDLINCISTNERLITYVVCFKKTNQKNHNWNICFREAVTVKVASYLPQLKSEVLSGFFYNYLISLINLM